MNLNLLLRWIALITFQKSDSADYFQGVPQNNVGVGTRMRKIWADMERKTPAGAIDQVLVLCPLPFLLKVFA